MNLMLAERPCFFATDHTKTNFSFGSHRAFWQAGFVPGIFRWGAGSAGQFSGLPALDVEALERDARIVLPLRRIEMVVTLVVCFTWRV